MKENPHIKPAVAVSADFTALQRGLEKIAAAFEELTKQLPSILKAVGDICERFVNLYPNKRVIHLMKHGKPRTRKKNKNRIIKYFEQQAKEPSKRRQKSGSIKYIVVEGKKRAVFEP